MDRAIYRDAGRLVHVPAGSAELEGDLDIPEGAEGIVLFAHGGGSTRFSPRDRFVAGVLQQGGLATLLIEVVCTAIGAVLGTIFIQ